jgi:hypothetical protein
MSGVSREVLGNVAVDNGQIKISGGGGAEELAVIVDTKFGAGYFPVIFEEVGEGGYGNARIIIELGPAHVAMA